MQCPLCGYTFDETLMACHTSCAFNKSCGIICCPNCGYQMADERKTRLASAVRNALARRKNGKLTGECTLSQLQPGQSGTVLEVQTDNHTRAEKLQVLGITPGAHIRLGQRHPAYVLQVGFTEISLEREVADEILVNVEV